MKRRDSSYPEDWHRFGERDLKRVRGLLSMGDLQDAGFHLQQAVEKHLKGFLLARGWKLRRIHDLESLLAEALKFDPAFDAFKPVCRKITQYYAEERYPSAAVSKLSELEIGQSLEAAEQLIAVISKHRKP